MLTIKLKNKVIKKNPLRGYLLEILQPMHYDKCIMQQKFLSYIVQMSVLTHKVIAVVHHSERTIRNKSQALKYRGCSKSLPLARNLLSQIS